MVLLRLNSEETFAHHWLSGLVVLGSAAFRSFDDDGFFGDVDGTTSGNFQHDNA